MPWWLSSPECGKKLFLLEINFYDFRLKFNKFDCERLRVCWIIELFPILLSWRLLLLRCLSFWFCLRTRFITFSPYERIFSRSRFDWLGVLITAFITGWLASPSNAGERDSDRRSTFDAQLVYATHLDISVSINWTKTKRRNGNNRHFMLIERFCRSHNGIENENVIGDFCWIPSPRPWLRNTLGWTKTLQSLSIAILT